MTTINDLDEYITRTIFEIFYTSDDIKNISSLRLVSREYNRIGKEYHQKIINNKAENERQIMFWNEYINAEIEIAREMYEENYRFFN
jgi:hypothetical protein